MKLFLGVLVILVAIIAIVILIINFLFCKMDKRDPEHIKKFNSIPDTLDVCNFGSSHGLYGFNYEELQHNGYKCFNFGLISQYISYDYRLVQHYGNHIDKGTVVFIIVSYFSLVGKDEKFNSDYEIKNKRYYLILPSKLIKDYDIIKNIFIKYLPIFCVDKNTIIKTLTGNGPVLDEIDCEWTKSALDIDIMSDAIAASRRHVGRKKHDDNGNLIWNQDEIDALYKLITYCKTKGAVPILVTTPYLFEYTNEVKKTAPDFYDKFYSIINDIIKSTKIKYCDYAFDERFSHNYGLFSNSDHLNKVGARQFTSILMKEVVGIQSDTE